MIFDIDQLSDQEKQWSICHNNIILKFFEYMHPKFSTNHFFHFIFINFVAAGGQNDG